MSVFQRKQPYSKYGPSDILAYNIRERLEYGFLELGAYTPIKFGLQTEKYTRLQRVKDDRYEDGQVFEGLGPSWVWQENVSTPNEQPQRPAGVWINEALYEQDSSEFPHRVDYRNGRIIFDNPVPRNLEVYCEYFINNIGIYTTDSNQWKVILNDYVHRFLMMESLTPEGLSSVLKEKRVWLPSIFIDIQGNADITGLQLGGGHKDNYEVAYHIYANSGFDQKNICDTLNDDDGKVLRLFDINKIPFPLGSNGSLSETPKEYLDLTKEYFWTFGYIKDSSGGADGISAGLYRGEITQTIEVARYLSTF